MTIVIEYIFLSKKMKFLIVFATILLVSSAHPPEELHKQWNNFKKIYQISYNAPEEEKRFNIFQENLKKIEGHNVLYEGKRTTYKMAVNRFADLTEEEFLLFLKSQQTIHSKPSDTEKFSKLPILEVPDEIDWREMGVVTDVKNQGQMGSSWIFSLTGSLESQNAIINNHLIPLSDQELIDCATNGSSSGFIDDGINYIINNGITAASDYPPSSNGTCLRDDIAATVTCSGITDIPTGDENSLKATVAEVGPISTAIEATTAWQFYAGGIILDPDCHSSDGYLNHEVVIVGYGQEDGLDYWIVKNSWGTNWGEEGYVRTVRNQDNHCGIATRAFYLNIK